MTTLDHVRPTLPRLILAETSGGLHHLGDRDDWVFRTICGLTIDPDPVTGINEPIPAGGDLRGVVTCPRCREEMR